jgi:hypothetical protein
MEYMRTLIYKRTHPGDPDVEGRFGIYDCMGQVRAWGFDAVIGVGGIGGEPESHGLARKVNWIGIGPHRRKAPNKRGPVVTFDHFRLFGDNAKAPSFLKLAPRLATRMYSKNVRVIMNDLDPRERGEVQKLLALAKHARPSSAGRAAHVEKSERCAPRAGAPNPVKGCSS